MPYYFLFTIQPAISHLNPMVPVARALISLGHEVAFATAESFLPTIIAKGFEALAAGPDWTTENEDEVFPERALLPVSERGAFDISVIFAEKAPPKMVADLRASFTERMPDVIVRDQLEFGGYLAAELAGIPHATINISSGFQASQRWLMAQIAEPLERHRNQYGLAADPALASFAVFR